MPMETNSYDIYLLNVTNTCDLFNYHWGLLHYKLQLGYLILKVARCIVCFYNAISKLIFFKQKQSKMQCILNKMWDYEGCNGVIMHYRLQNVLKGAVQVVFQLLSSFSLVFPYNLRLKCLTHLTHPGFLSLSPSASLGNPVTILLCFC